MRHNCHQGQFNKSYARRIKLSDRYLDFDPFDNPYGRSMLYYPKMTLWLLLKFRYGIFHQGDDHKNTCYSFGNSKRELHEQCDKSNASRLKELKERRVQ